MAQNGPSVRTTFAVFVSLFQMRMTIQATLGSQTLNLRTFAVTLGDLHRQT